MGVVFRARAADGRAVAIKLLTRPTSVEARARFERERRLLASLGESDGFVPLLDAGEEKGQPYLVMPLLEGGTLRARLARGALSIPDVISLGEALGVALATAHARGVVHRDLKPDNILYGPGGRPLVADLGIAKHFAGDSPGASQSVALSRTGELLGTVGYMAPEQAMDAKAAGPAADVFSSGAILYECLTGWPAFEGRTLVEVMEKVLGEVPSPITNVRPETPPWLAAVVDRALARDPRQRFPDGAALLAAVRAREAGYRPPGQPLGALSAAKRGLVAAPLLVALLVLGYAVLARPGGEGLEDPVRHAPRSGAAPGPELPRGVRPASKETLPDGKEVQVYAFRLPDGSDLELVSVPPGDFFMGSDDEEAGDQERPKHRHAMNHGYWIGRYDVTWRQFLAFCGATHHPMPKRPEWAGDDHPVVNVSWVDAQAYCAWAKLSLPSEAEWEKAARGTDGRKYPWGDAFEPTLLNFADKNAPAKFTFANGETDDLQRDMNADDGSAFTSPVGHYARGASPYGALDMAGNVVQWCEEWYDAQLCARYAQGDTAPPTSGNLRVAHGGAWCAPARYSRPSNRSGGVPDYRMEHIGFRVALRP
jgi:formylglycine-generating enzyme required for sulfatase activity